MDTVSMLNKMSFYCQPILPLVYDESMSYYETLCKVVGQLNTTGDAVNKLNAGLTEEATERENADAALGARLAELEKTFANVHLIAFENPGRIIGTAPTREQLYKWVTSGDVICTLLRTSEPGRENIFAVTCNYDAGSYLSPLSNDFEIVVPIKTSYNENNDTAVSQKLVKLTIPDGELSETWGYQEFEIKTPATSADGIVNVNARHYNTGTIDVNITPSEFLGMFYTHKAGAQIAVGVNARLTYDGRDYASGSAVVSVGDGTNGKVIIEFNNYYNGVFTENDVDQLKTQHIFLVGAQATNTWAIETIDSHTYDLERDKAFEFTHNVDGTVTTGEDSTPSEVAFYYERNDKLYQNIPVRLIDTKDNAEYWNGVFDRKSDGRISYTFTTSYYRASKMLVRIIELSATPKSGSTFAGDEKWVYAAKEFELPLDNALQAVTYTASNVGEGVYSATKHKTEYQVDFNETTANIIAAIESGKKVILRVDLKDPDSNETYPVYFASGYTRADPFTNSAHYIFAGTLGGDQFTLELNSLLTHATLVTYGYILPEPNPDGSDNGKVPAVNGTKWELKELPVDNVLSSTSVNPVQNKVVKAALDGKANTAVATTSANGLMASADKTKLDGVAVGANKTIVDAALSSTSTNPVQNKAVKTALDGKASTAVATTSTNGLMSAADKTKLGGVADGATRVIVDSAMSATSTNPVQNKVVKKYIDDSVAGGGSSNNAVLYTAQTLTTEQKQQARKNIDAVGNDSPQFQGYLALAPANEPLGTGIGLSPIGSGNNFTLDISDVNENTPTLLTGVKTPTDTDANAAVNVAYILSKGYLTLDTLPKYGGETA